MTSNIDRFQILRQELLLAIQNTWVFSHVSTFQAGKLEVHRLVCKWHIWQVANQKQVLNIFYWNVLWYKFQVDNPQKSSDIIISNYTHLAGG